MISLSSVQAPASPAATRNAPGKKQFLFPSGWPNFFYCRSSSFNCRSPCTRRTAGRKIFHYLTNIGQLVGEDWKFVRHAVRCLSVTGVPSLDVRRETSVLQPSTDYPPLPVMPMPPPTIEMATPWPPYLLHSQKTSRNTLSAVISLCLMSPLEWMKLTFEWRIDLDEQIRSRIDQSIATDCSTFRPPRPSSTVYRTVVWDKL